MPASIFCLDTHNPYCNLAVEDYFKTNANTPTLLLWQNAHTVVIGRCQNVWKEVNVSLCQSEDVSIARRFTGGGAVYHDLGNLNYSFIMPEKIQDVKKQTQLIIDALFALGINAVASGRNDLEVDGKKISGNAYSFGKNHLHHGTLMVDVALDSVSKYLTPAFSKLQSKGIESVRSRVMNLSGVCPDISIDAVSDAICKEFIKTYDAKIETSLPDEAALFDLISLLQSDSWRLNQSPTFEVELENRFDWGSVQLHLNIKQGTITDASIFSDAFVLDPIEALPTLLVGHTFQNMADALLENTAQLSDIKAWLQSL